MQNTKVNNFKSITDILKFPNERAFYFLQVIKRKKENPNLNKNQHIADFYIRSKDQLEKSEKSLIKLCNSENARAYIRINVRDEKRVAMEVLKSIVDHISLENYSSVRKAYASCSGSFHSDPDKKWIIDIDWKDIDLEKFITVENYINTVTEYIRELIRDTDRKDEIYTIPTKNGVHIICRPFNLQKFGLKYPLIDVHKDGMTLLYCA